MSHFAQIDDQNIVQQVLVIEQAEIDTGNWGNPAQWVQTSYNTRGGIYYIPETTTPDLDQSKAFRKNYAGIGYTYNAALDAFIPPQPYSSWTLNTFTCDWNSPVPYPMDGLIYSWDEQTLSWVTNNSESQP